MKSSFARYLGSGRDQNVNSVLRESCSLLLTRLAAAPAIADETARATFVEDIQRFDELLRESANAEDILRTAEAAAQVTENYSRGVTVFVRRQSSALKSIVNTIAETVASILGEDPPHAEKLRRISNHFGAVDALNDLDTLQSEFDECLTAVRQDYRRLLEGEPASPRPQTVEHHDEDPATGLSLRPDCIKVMRSPVPPDKTRYAVVFAVSSLATINSRFGRAVGDRVLCRFGEFVVQQIQPTDRLFRWDGPILVAILERDQELAAIETEITAMMEKKLIEETVDSEGRFKLIPITASWTAFSFVPSAPAERQVDAFAATQKSRSKS